jgi:hypothetical protein
MKTRLITASLLVAGCTTQHDVEQTITITPQTTNVMTCSTEQFTAAVTGFDDLQVSWSANHGSVDATGLYTSPMTMQADASVTATSMADPNLSATAQVTLATAFPSAAHPIGGAPGTDTISGTVGIYQHEVASKGDRVYTVWASNPAGSSTPSVSVARSDDGGVTWRPGVVAVPIMLANGMQTDQAWAECTAIAIDAGNPDVVYLTTRISGGNQYSAMVGTPDEPALIYAVSSDGGATFTQTVLRSTTDSGICADVISPAPDHVIVADPTDECAAPSDPRFSDVWVFSDAHRGAGWTTGNVFSMNEYEANGNTHGLSMIDGRACDDPARIDVQQDGGTDTSGEAVESPRLFTDGAGRTCLSYIATSTGQPGTPVYAYVNCSDDFGVTWTLPHKLDPAAPAGTVHSQAVGAFGPHGAAAVVWVRQPQASAQTAYLFIATSNDGGNTFGAEVQVPTYVLPGTTGSSSVVNPAVSYDADGILWIAYRTAENDRIIVDKSCDNGLTWSGSVLVSGTEQQITDATFPNMKWPVFVPTTGKAPRLAATGTGATNLFDLAP